MCKNQIVRVLIFLLILLISNNISYSQSLPSSNDWEVYTEIEGVQILWKTSECNDSTNGKFESIVSLKFINTMDIDLAISWESETWINNIKNQASDNPISKIALDAGTVVEYDCSLQSYENSQLRYFLYYANHPDMDKVENIKLINIIIIPNNK